MADGSCRARRRTVRENGADLADAVDGTEFVVTHGNGPQVGTRLLDVAETDTLDRPLDVLVAVTQAAIAGDLRDGLEADIDRPVAGLLTRVVVDHDDPSFDDPTKRIGPWYTEEQAAEVGF